MKERNERQADQMLEELEAIINIDSPSGYHYIVQEYLVNQLKSYGYDKVKTLRKGGLIADLGGEGNPIMLLAHMDTLGCFVSHIKADGRLAISNMTLNPNNIETETVRIITRGGAIYEGTIQLANASVHVNSEVNQARDFTSLEVVIDEEVSSAEEVKALGISAGDIIAVEPRFTVTKQGYIKSRYLDDKASVAILMQLAREIKEENIQLTRNVQIYFTAFEEIGHGAATGIPEEIVDVLSVDMGCVGEHLTCTETMVSICAKDSAGPYHFEMTNELIDVAKRKQVDYAVDIYPRYSSDAQLAMKSGYDVRHTLIGPGVYASHGYERTHVKGLLHTLHLILGYVAEETK